MAPEKFKHLVHYVIAKCDDPSRLGAVKLNKVLWFSDSIAYRLNGVSITGESYVKRQHGPVPKHILATLRELTAENIIAEREREHFGYQKREFVALAQFDPSAFSEQEREIIDEVIDFVCNNHTASSISELSHDKIWDVANVGEEIPMFATLSTNSGELTKDVLEWADSVVERIESEKVRTN